LQNKLPQAICNDKHQVAPAGGTINPPAFCCAIARTARSSGDLASNGLKIRETEKRMAETKVVTEVAGRVCALVANVGDQIGEGDDIILVEAMKMELPVGAPDGGTVKTILVKIDDIVAEGQVVATIES